MRVDYLVVGSGLTGSTIARLLKDEGKDVLVVERRPHIGGNIHDHTHPSGIRVHTYGPHTFRTDNKDVWRFVNSFTRFYKYELEVKTLVDGVLENWPILGNYIKEKVGVNWKPEYTGNPRNFEEACLSMMPRTIYKQFVKGYTEKMWGVKATELSSELVKRFDVRLDDDPRLKKERYQGLPALGYTKLIQNMLEGIPILLNTDYLRYRNQLKATKKIFYTGGIDEYYNYIHGRLGYRGLHFTMTYHPLWLQPCPVINNPLKTVEHIRTIEWKYLMPNEYANKISGTVVTKELPYTPNTPNDFMYPFPDEANRRLYEKYAQNKTNKTVFAGRLGEFKYLDMDHAIEHATETLNQLLG